MLDKIREDINARLAKQPDSRCATGDEVSICWLIGEIDRLQHQLSTNKKIAETNRADAVKKAMLDTACAACHEFNQPLQAIMSHLEMLNLCIKDNNFEGLTRRVDILIKQTARAGDITYKMMNLKRYKTKKHDTGGAEMLDIEESYIPKEGR